jgi:hypothetical protein
MAETYVQKKRSDLIFLLNNEYYRNTAYKDIKKIQFLLLEVKYNIFQQNPEDFITVLINKAIELTKDLLQTQRILIETLNREKKLDAPDLGKHLSLENILEEIIIEIKKVLGNISIQ